MITKSLLNRPSGVCRPVCSRVQDKTKPPSNARGHIEPLRSRDHNQGVCVDADGWRLAPLAARDPESRRYYELCLAGWRRWLAKVEAGAWQTRLHKDSF